MRSLRLLSMPVWAAVALLGLAVVVGCGDDDEISVTPTDGPTSTPFSLGTTLAIRGQEVVLPEGVDYINQTTACQQEATASSAECANEFKMLVRGRSYILFDTAQEQVIARRIEPEDETDFRPLLGLISGTTGGDASNGETQSPGP